MTNPTRRQVIQFSGASYLGLNRHAVVKKWSVSNPEVSAYLTRSSQYLPQRSP